MTIVNHYLHNEVNYHLATKPDNTPMKTFGARLRVAREKAGLNQSQLATMADVNKMTISALENEKNKAPTPENLFKIADSVRCNPRWLATGMGEIDGPETNRPQMNISSERLALMLDKLPEAKRHELIKLAEQVMKIQKQMESVVDN